MHCYEKPFSSADLTLMFERTIKSLVSYYENKHQSKILKLQNKQLFGKKNKTIMVALVTTVLTWLWYNETKVNRLICLQQMIPIDFCASCKLTNNT